MSYAQIHTQAVRHPKVKHLSPSAFRLWIAGLCYCQEHLTDGVLSPKALACLGFTASPTLRQELVAAGLWDEVPEGGYRVHDYGDWNLTRDVIERKKAQARARLERFRQQRVANAFETLPIRNATQYKKKDTAREATNRPAPQVEAGRKPKPGYRPRTAGAPECLHEPMCENCREHRDRVLADAKAAQTRGPA